MSESKEGLRSIHLELENFKNITKKIVNIEGKSMIFIGRNESGKSTLIQAMSGPMNNKLLPSEPVKKGESHARISHTIGGILNGEEKVYIMDMYFTDKSQKGKLSITNEKGEIMKSPSTLIKSIIGNVSFDITQWLNDEKKKKLETLKQLTGKGKEIDSVNMEISELKALRKKKSDRADDLEATLKNHEFTPAEIELYSEPSDLSLIQSEMKIVADNQKQWDDVYNKVESFKTDVARSNGLIAKTEVEINELEEKLHALRERIAFEKGEVLKNDQNIRTGAEWLQNVPRPSMEEANKKMSEAISHNEKHYRIGILGTQQKEMIKVKSESEKLKTDIEVKTNERNQIIASSQLSIPGLSFTDEEIFIDGLPLEEEQINSARLIDIGVDVAISMNPNLKIIFIKDGSLLDSKHLKIIVDKIEKNGYQAIIEMVDFEGGELECKFTEEALS